MSTNFSPLVVQTFLEWRPYFTASLTAPLPRNPWALPHSEWHCDGRSRSCLPGSSSEDWSSALDRFPEAKFVLYNSAALATVSWTVGTWLQLCQLDSLRIRRDRERENVYLCSWTWNMQIWKLWARHELFHVCWEPRKSLCTGTCEIHVQRRERNIFCVPTAAAFLALGSVGHPCSLTINSFVGLKLTHEGFHYLQLCFVTCNHST